jgi:hypothetical protein
MNTPTQKGISLWSYIAIILIIAGLTFSIVLLITSPIQAAALAAEPIVAGCGTATMDGVIDPVEWSGATRITSPMINSAGEPFTIDLYVMNSGVDLYLAIAIDDDEFTLLGEYLPYGDGFRIDFDNDFSGTLFALNDDVLSIYAGGPQFEDQYIYNDGSHSCDIDELGGGLQNGAGAASRVGDFSHFELKHPLCSGDNLDFCLKAEDSIGFRLEYLDAEGNGDFGGSQYYPGSSDTSEAEIVISECTTYIYTFMPLLSK